MSLSIRDEKRYLSPDDFDIVQKSHMPALSAASDDELRQLLELLRARRDQARDIARQQRREMRGKARARGARPAADNTGTTIKKQIFASAIQRLNKERARRELRAGRDATQAGLARALEMRAAAAAQPSRPKPGRTPRKGMRAKPSETDTVTPDPRETGRVSQAVKSAQARRDSR